MKNKGKLQANISRLRDQKTENLSKMDEARSSTERKHYRMLAVKNEEMIENYEEMMEDG